MLPTIVYPARLVHTMDPAGPVGEAVAVRGSRVRAVGTVEELMAYPNTKLDRRFADKVLLPGFVEAHSHAGTGTVWEGTYIGFVDRRDPDGRNWPGCQSLQEVVARLKEEESKLTDSDVTLRGWGFDSIYFPGEVLTAAELDKISMTRPIYVAHTSGHACVVNSAAMELCGIDANTEVEGVIKNSEGQPTGELHEFAAMGLAASVAGGGLLSINGDSLRRFGQDAVNSGTTTLTDLGSVLLMEDAGVELYRDSINEDFPARLNVFHFGAGVGSITRSFRDVADRLIGLRKQSTEKLRFGNVKLMLDGTLQGFTARVQEPGYFGTEDNGIWNVTPEEFYDAFEEFHRAGLLIHVHCNGDQATQLFLDTLEAVLVKYPRPDHRHTCTHSQMSTVAQYKRMAALGACANIFANHIWAWGDQHLDITVGPDRARRNNAAGTALRLGVPIALHSDTPVTPLNPLATAKHAVTRRTVSGRIMGEYERIGVEEALQAVTIGAAFMLKMDHEVGSIEAGKYADMAVLDEDPLSVDPLELDNIHICGTMVGGEFYPSMTEAPVE